MIRWSEYFPKYKYPWGYIKLLKTYWQYFDHPTVNFKDPLFLKCLDISGKQRELSKLYNKHKGERCFILGNGPSLQLMDLSCLEDEVTIGSNGIYRNFDKLGFSTDYLVTDDVVQTEIRGRELAQLKGPVKLASLYNAHAFPLCNDFLYFNVPSVVHDRDYYFESEMYPQFSQDFASVVHLGYTVTYIMLQLAYFMGFEKVYLIGADHSYGELSKRYPPGKVLITEENYEIVKKCHFDPDYYKLGDHIGVPHVEMQDKSYLKAEQMFRANRRKVFNAGINSQLDVFEFVEFKSLFND